jgi:hypothetical protein
MGSTREYLWNYLDWFLPFPGESRILSKNQLFLNYSYSSYVLVQNLFLIYFQFFLFTQLKSWRYFRLNLLIINSKRCFLILYAAFLTQLPNVKGRVLNSWLLSWIVYVQNAIISAREHSRNQKSAGCAKQNPRKYNYSVSPSQWLSNLKSPPKSLTYLLINLMV